jgi:hypothetical protein
VDQDTTSRKPDNRRPMGMRAKALKFSIEGSEPGKGWITVGGWGFLAKARHSKITSKLLRFLAGLSVELQALIEMLRVIVAGHSQALFREKICFARLNAPIVTTKLSIC